MKETVYVETTVISYLTAWPSRDLVRAGQQQIVEVCEEAGYAAPIICTPEELTEALP